MIKRILCKDNFEVWHKYNRMEAAVGELRGFIDAGILDVCPDVLIRRFVEAEALCEDFYRTVQHTVGSTGAIQFDIDFKSGIYDVQPEDGTFDRRSYLLNTLDLYPEYRKKVEELMYGADALCDETLRD